MDPAFQTIPFEKWLTEPDELNFRWKVSVSRPELSYHQRLLGSIEAELDGSDLEPRRNDGQMVIFYQLTYGDGTHYQGHTAIELKHLDENVGKARIQTAQPVFILPGDYQLDVALLDTRTHEHATSRSKFRVATPASHLLQEGWRSLPAVEFIHEAPSPDSWYLPNIESGIRWLSDLSAPASLTVLLNVSPSVTPLGTRSTSSEGLPALLPTFKVMSHPGSAQVAEHLEVLDMERRRAVLQVEIGRGEPSLLWSALKSSLNDANPAAIDVRSLSSRQQSAQFFLLQLRRLLRSSDKPSVVVILTTPIAFEEGEDLTPISLESLPAARIFYVRYHDPQERSYPSLGPTTRGRGRGDLDNGPIARHRAVPVNTLDQLEPTLKPLKPKVFDVQTPEEMTKALAEIHKALLN